jgi:hypothetical protein
MNWSNFTPANVHHVYFALFQNGRILGLSCGQSFPMKSKPASPEIPLSLQPTLLQMSAVHWAWIDRFPFPAARDKMIIESANIEEEDLMADFFSMPTFVIEPGCQSWDPSGWTICPEFKAKWGYLFE